MDEYVVHDFGAIITYVYIWDIIMTVIDRIIRIYKGTDEDNRGSGRG